MKKRPRNSVELFPAFYWICNNCNEQNFGECIPVEISASDAQNMSEFNGIPIELCKTGNWFDDPQKVECKKCEKTYKALSFRGSLDEADFDFEG
jgi:protein-arginine kinase activator protein McsA